MPAKLCTKVKYKQVPKWNFFEVMQLFFLTWKVIYINMPLFEKENSQDEILYTEHSYLLLSHTNNGFYAGPLKLEWHWKCRFCTFVYIPMPAYAETQTPPDTATTSLLSLLLQNLGDREYPASGRHFDSNILCTKPVLKKHWVPVELVIILPSGLHIGDCYSAEKAPWRNLHFSFSQGVKLQP